jgi:hypothetical protein
MQSPVAPTVDMDSDIMDDSVFDDIENDSDAFTPEPVSFKSLPLQQQPQGAFHQYFTHT